MAPAPLLSRSQLSYTLTGLLSSPPHRQDDRALLAFRPLALETGIAPQAAGSARCELGGTEAVVVVSAEVVQDREAESSSSRISCNLDSSPAMQASDTFSTLLTHLLTLMSSLFVDLVQPHSSLEEQLIILRSPYTGKPTRAWKLHVDASIQRYDGGNIADVLFATLHAAIWDLRLPRTSVMGIVEDIDSVKDKLGVHGLSMGNTAGGETIDAMTGIKGPLARHKGQSKVQTQGQGQGKDGEKGPGSRVQKAGVDFEMQDVWDGGEPWRGRDNFPVGVTVNVLPKGTLLDATLAEEACLPPSRRLLVLYAPFSSKDSGKGEVRAVQTVPSTIDVAATVGGEATVDESESMMGTLPYARLSEAIKAGAEHAKAFHQALRSQLSDPHAAADDQDADQMQT